MKSYENDDIKVEVSFDTVSVYFKKTRELVLAKMRYRIYVNNLIESKVNKIEPESNA